MASLRDAKLKGKRKELKSEYRSSLSLFLRHSEFGVRYSLFIGAGVEGLFTFAFYLYDEVI